MWLRTASKDDLSQMHALLLESLHATYDDVIGVETVNKLTAERHSLDSLKKYLGRPSSEYVVVDDGEILHGGAYAVQGLIASEPEIAYIIQLYVRPENQRQGIGTRLLMEIEESFPSARKVRIEVFEKGQSAIQFLESQNYKAINAKPLFSADDINFSTIVMEKVLF